MSVKIRDLKQLLTRVYNAGYIIILIIIKYILPQLIKVNDFQRCKKKKMFEILDIILKRIFK